MRKMLMALVSVLSISFISSCATIDPGHVGVVVRMSKVQDQPLSPGWHGVNPFISDVVAISMQGQSLADEVGQNSTDAASVTFEETLQSIGYTAQVIWSVSNPDVAIGLVEHYGLRDDGEEMFATSYIQPAVRAGVKQALTRYSLRTFVESQATVSSEAAALAQTILDGRLSLLPAGSIKITSLTITNFDYADSLEASFAATTAKQQEVELAEQELARTRVEQQGQLVQAQAARQALVERSTGEAEAMRIQAEAVRLQREQEALGYTALREAGVDPALVIRARTMETLAGRWSGTLPATFAPADGNSQIFRMFNMN